MSHQKLEQLSRFTNRTIPVKNNQLRNAGQSLIQYAKNEGYSDQQNFFKEHHPPSFWRGHYRFMENKRMYSEGLKKRVEFSEAGYTPQGTSFIISRGVDDNPRILAYKNIQPLDRKVWRHKYRDLLNGNETSSNK